MFVYIRTNEWCDNKDVYKVGITKSIIDRNNTYITGEIIKGRFVKIFKLEDINYNQLKTIDKIIKSKFQKINVYHQGGGKEFYKRIISEELEKFFIKHHIKFQLVNEEDLKRLNRTIYNPVKFTEFIKKYLEFKETINPKIHQKDILDTINNFYEINNIGKLIWTCGLGKTIMSILIIKEMKFKKILIGVPNCYLQSQFIEEILRIFNNKSNILLLNGDYNNIKEVQSFLHKDTNQPLFVITTYHSCYLLTNEHLLFDFKIGDECHHLVAKDDDKKDKRKFIYFHKIQSLKTLYMTATKKTIINDCELCYSMENEEIFGKTIDEKTFKWAIDNHMITDYKILMIDNQITQLNEIKHRISTDISNRELFICVYLSLKALALKINEDNPPPSHLLIYANDIKDTELIKLYINEILTYDIIDIDKTELFHNALHSKIDKKTIEDSLDKFKNAKYGIIACCDLFGEGFNCPEINGITVACNMRSEIGINQKFLRANRKDIFKQNKIAYYILPQISNDNYDNISNIVKQLRNIDENIEQKIMVYNLTYQNSSHPNHLSKPQYEFINNPELLLKIRMKLRNSRDLICDLTAEENEYNYVKSINKHLKLSSRIDYENSKEIHENFIENPNKYFLNKGVWSNWGDFLGYDTSLFIQTKQKWISFCKEKEVKSIKDYNDLSNIYKELPKDPEDFYNNFSNILNELGLLKARR